MEEFTEGMEQTADQQDSFLDGWDDTTDRVQMSDAGSQSSEVSSQMSEDSSQTTEAQTEAETEGQTAATVEEQAWIVKHMGEQRTVSAKEITPELLQKGLDYDRVRGKYDEAKPVMEMFTEFAKNAGMSVSDYAKYIRAEAKKASGMNEDEARRAVELEDREAAVKAFEAVKTAEREAKSAQDARIQSDLANFRSAFPEVYEQARTDPKAIPQSVWKNVTGGKMTLTAAYSQYAVAQAQELARAATEAAQTAQNNQRNAARSMGSMRSAGSDSKARDAFAAAFDEG